MAKQWRALRGSSNAMTGREMEEQCQNCGGTEERGEAEEKHWVAKKCNGKERRCIEKYEKQRI